MTGLASGAHTRKHGGEPLTYGSQSALGTAADFHGGVNTPSVGLTLTKVHEDQEKPVYLPAIEVGLSEEQRQQRIPTGLTLSAPNDQTEYHTRSTSPLGTPSYHDTRQQQQRMTMGPPLSSHRDAAYIRSRSLTPSLLGAPRDLLPRSKKTSLFAGYLPNLAHSEDDGGHDGGNLTLAVEGHHDLKLPPRRTPTESRKAEKSRHKLSTPILHMLDGYDAYDDISLEENLKTLLLCQSMGVRLEVANIKRGHDNEKSVRPVFHCPRCLKHWAEHGTTPQYCDEPEIPTSGPTFEISNRSHEIIREFANLSIEDKQQVVVIIMGRESPAIGGRDGHNSKADAVLTGRRATEVGESVMTAKTTTDITDSVPASLKCPNKYVEQTHTTHSGENSLVCSQHTTTDETVVHPITPHSPLPHDDTYSKYDASLGIPIGDIGHVGQQYQAESTIAKHDAITTSGSGVTDMSIRPETDNINAGYQPVSGKLYRKESQLETGQYGPDGEMAALKASQTTRQGVVGPDGLFYPHGFYQSDGKFIQGGPPHSGHPVVWGPTLGTHEAGYPFPPTEFGPAWPPGVPAPYTHERETHDRQHLLQIGIDEQALSFTDDEAIDNIASATADSSLTPTEHPYADHKSLQVDPTDTIPHLEHGEETDGMKHLESQSSSIDNGDLHHPRDLFSPWGKDEELPNLQITASVSFHQIEKRRRDDDGRICVRVKSSQSAGRKSGITSLQTNMDVKGQGGVGNSKVNVLDDQDHTKVQKTTGTDMVGPKKPKDNTAAYMGVVDRTDSSNSTRDSSHPHIAKARRGSVAADVRTGSGRRGSKALPIAKPGKNPAVKNVTGKPETKPGMLQKHMFATPSTTLTQTNTIGINNTSKSISSKDDVQVGKPKLPSIGGGEPIQDGVSHRSPSPVKQQSISRIGSGEKRRMSSIDNVMVPPEESVKPRSGKRGAKVKKKTGKVARKTVGKRQDARGEEERKGIEKAANDTDAIKDVFEANNPEVESPLPVKQQMNNTMVGTYHDIVKEAETTISRANCEERESITKLTDSSSILDKFSEFRISVPASSSPLPTEHAPSFRMTYSTLPNFGTTEPESTASKSNEAFPIKTEKKPSKSKSIPFDFEKVEKGYNIRARTSSTRSLSTKRSRQKQTIKPRTARDSVSSDTSTRPSSAESVWESLSEIWKRNREEIANLKKCVADSYLPLTHAYTFSMFPLAPGYAAHNRAIWERASAIKQLRKPVKFNKSRRAAKHVKKRSTVGEKVLPVKTVESSVKTVAPVK
ncbi:uncharacterized protein [Amphiura filiformis]|uniref:uncharacterized protein n=1 Tax=Amphiura filiformis TaxID=82378 RepID=UPI003B20D39C